MLFRHENRCLFHGSNFNPSPLTKTKLWKCEEQESLCPPNKPVRGERWWGPISNTRSHIMHSHDHPITEWCNPNYFPTQLGSKLEKSGGSYLHTDRPTSQPTNQRICRQFCQQHADHLCQKTLPISYGNGRFITIFKRFATQPHCVSFLMLCIPCAVDNQFAMLNQQNSPHSSLDIYVIL